MRLYVERGLSFYIISDMSTDCDGPLKYVDCGHEQKLLFCVVKLHVACPQYGEKKL